MENITIENKIVTFRGSQYMYVGYEIIDNFTVHLILDKTTISLIINDTKINDTVCSTVEQIINILEA